MPKSRPWLLEENVALENSHCGSLWTRDEDRAFENALAVHFGDPNCWDKIAAAVPGKTLKDLKLHYECLKEDIAAIESGKFPLPRYADYFNLKQEGNLHSSSYGVQRGAPWTIEEHRRFLHGLQRFGKGDWKSISRYCVVTKTNSQVASHAQKYFMRLNSVNKERKRASINDITSVHPKSMSAIETPMTNGMPGVPTKDFTNIWKLLHLPIGDICAPFASKSIQEVGTSTIIMPTCFSPYPSIHYGPLPGDKGSGYAFDASLF